MAMVQTEVTRKRPFAGCLLGMKSTAGIEIANGKRTD